MLLTFPQENISHPSGRRGGRAHKNPTPPEEIPLPSLPHQPQQHLPLVQFHMLDHLHMLVHLLMLELLHILVPLHMLDHLHMLFPLYMLDHLHLLVHLHGGHKNPSLGGMLTMLVDLTIHWGIDERRFQIANDSGVSCVILEKLEKTQDICFLCVMFPFAKGNAFRYITRIVMSVERLSPGHRR